MNQRDIVRSAGVKVYEVTKSEWCFKNNLGQFVCRLCSTVHPNEANMYVHFQGKRHKNNAARVEDARRRVREAQEQREAGTFNAQQGANGGAANSGRAPRIGRPIVTMRKEIGEGKCSLRIELSYPLIEEGTRPLHRFLNTFEQSKEQQDPSVMYLLFAAEPYETVAIKLPFLRVDQTAEGNRASWDGAKKVYSLFVTLHDT